MGQWDMATAQSIGTLGLGPCIGVAVYDPTYLRGYLSHAFADDLSVIETMLAKITDDTDEMINLDCWVSGGEVFPGCEQLCESARTDTLKLLGNIGLRENQTELLWVEDAGCAIMTLDCLSGQCEVARVYHSE